MEKGSQKYRQLVADLENYIELNYIDNSLVLEVKCCYYAEEMARPLPGSFKREETLAELLHQEEKTFSEKVFEFIDRKGLDEVEVYQAANLDRKLFSKLRRRTYKPSKNTALALVIGMKLNMKEAKELLSYAGFALSPCSKTDIIVSFFLENEAQYDIYLLNDILEQKGEKILGNSLA